VWLHVINFFPLDKLSSHFVTIDKGNIWQFSEAEILKRHVFDHCHTFPCVTLASCDCHLSHAGILLRWCHTFADCHNIFLSSHPHLTVVNCNIFAYSHNGVVCLLIVTMVNVCLLFVTMMSYLCRVSQCSSFDTSGSHICQVSSVTCLPIVTMVNVCLLFVTLMS
jgi:hypothetical protein